MRERQCGGGRRGTGREREREEAGEKERRSGERDGRIERVRERESERKVRAERGNAGDTGASWTETK